MAFLFGLHPESGMFVFSTFLSRPRVAGASEERRQTVYLLFLAEGPVSTQFLELQALIPFPSFFGDAIGGLSTEQLTLFSYCMELVTNLGNALPKKENTRKIVSH